MAFLLDGVFFVVDGGMTERLSFGVDFINIFFLTFFRARLFLEIRTLVNLCEIEKARLGRANEDQSK